MRNLLRNCVGIIIAIMLYWVLFYTSQLLVAKGGDGLLLLFALHIGFGVLGYFLFAGRNLIRAVCVFLAVVINGVAMEILNPDPKHALVQVFVAVAFGIVAAGSVSGGSFLREHWSEATRNR